MKREDILARLRTIYVEHLDFGYDVNDITEETDCEKDLDFDSLDEIEVILEVEREFEISIPDDALDNMGRKVGDLVAYLENALKE